jgi:hypothetical protein
MKVFKSKSGGRFRIEVSTNEEKTMITVFEITSNKQINPIFLSHQHHAIGDIEKNNSSDPIEQLLVAIGYSVE